MTESLKRLQDIFSPLASELLADGPDPSIDIAIELTASSCANPNAWYVGRVSQLQEHAAGLTCALIKDVPLSEKAAKGNNIFLFSADVEISVLIEKIEQYFAGRAMLSRQTDNIYRAYLSKEGLDTIIKTAAKEFGCGLIVIGPDSEVLACSDITGISLTASERASGLTRIISELPTDDQLLNTEETRWEIADSSTAYCIHEQVYDGNVVVSIKNNGILLSNLLVKCDGKPLDIWDERHIALIVQIIAAKLTDTERISDAKDYSCERFIIHLLENSIENREMLESSAKLFDMDIQGYFALLLVKVTQYQKIIIGTQALRDGLDALTGEGHSAVHKDEIIILLRYTSENDYSGHDTGEIVQYLQQNKLYGVRSRLFHSLDEVHKHYTKSRKLLELNFCAPEGKYFITMEDMGIYAIADALLRAEDKDDIIEPIIRVLAETDNRKNTSYIETLYMYLKYSRNPTIARQHLYIHRNTLDYRIQKISELTGIDWNNGDLLFRLYLSIIIMKFIQNKDKAD